MLPAPVNPTSRSRARLRRLNAVSIALSGLWIVGCTHVAPHTIAEQREAYAAQERRPIPVVLDHPDADPAHPLALAPDQFINLHTAAIVTATHLDGATLLSHLQLSPPIRDGTSHEAGYTVTVPPEVIVGQAGATAVAADGYFLTANHAVKAPALVLISHGFTPSKELELRPRIPRIVARFPEVDLALLHIDLPTSHYLTVRHVPLQPGEVIYGASWFNAPTAGTFLEIERRYHVAALDLPTLQVDTRLIRLPSRPGDSGFPFIDTTGQLCGISVAGRHNRFGFKAKPEAVAAMIDPADLERLIAADRARLPR